MSPDRSFWSQVKDWYEEAFRNCCCCSSKDISHERFDNPTAGNGFSSSAVHENPVLDLADENFAEQVLDTPETKWRPKLVLHDASSNEDEARSQGDLSQGPGALYSRESAHRKVSTSTRESGIGRSLDDSQTSSSSIPELAVSVVGGTSKTAYRILLVSGARSWSVHRTASEFYQMQKIINTRLGRISAKLPPPDKISACYLEDYAKKVIAQEASLRMSEIRLFFKLDSGMCSSSSTDSYSTSPSSSSEKRSEFILDPHYLAPSAPGNKGSRTRPAVGGRKRDRADILPGVHSPEVKEEKSSINGVDLGCVEKKMSPDDFTFLSIIGKGSFGRVMLARRRDNNKAYAVKVLSKKMIVRRNETAHVLSERSVLIRVMKHPYLVQLHYAFTTPTKIFFVLDYINGGELFFHLQKERTFSEKRAKFYAAEICCALCYMHTMGIIYRDLKPENILLDREGHVVLTDFGLCKEGLETGSSRTSTFCGTPEYLAPEVILKEAYTRSVDWWTLGAVLYEMLYGLPPFYSRETPVMYQAILHKPLRLRITVSAKARSILSALLQKDPTKRLGSGPTNGEEVKGHAFFQDVDWKAVEERKTKPPFVPRVGSDDDTSNIDPVFTREPLSSPPVSNSGGMSSSPDSDAVFQGFSFIPPSAIEEDPAER